MFKSKLLFKRTVIGTGLALLFLGLSLSAQKGKKEEQEDYFKKWMNEDVAYIITDEEKAIFQKLTTDEERERFIEAFWRRRDPDPRTPENEYKEEYYRRIAYANEKFAAGMAGWKTDRGKVYIKFGPPDQVDTYPTGTTETDVRGGVVQAIGGQSNPRGPVTPREYRTFPFEVWYYRYLPGMGSDVKIEFVDKTGSGLYTLASNDEEKNVFAYKDKAADVASPNQSDLFRHRKDTEFYRTELLAHLEAPPPVTYHDLDAVVSSRVHYDQIPFTVSTSLLQVTPTSYYVPVSFILPARNLDFKMKGEAETASVNIFLKATNVQKRVMAVVEDSITLSSAPQQLEQTKLGNAFYQKKLLLPPGRYVINLVLKDNNSDKLGTMEKLVVIPHPSETVSLSSVILADVIRPLRENESLSDPFAIGTHKVIPNVAHHFSKSQKAGVYFQIYGLSLDQSTLKPDVEMEASFQQGDRQILDIKDNLQHFGSVNGNRASVTLAVPLHKFPAGTIDVHVKVKDKLTGKSTEKTTQFTVAES